MSKPGKDLLVWRMALSSSPRRGTLLGPGSQSRPSELEDICSGQLSGEATSFTEEIFSADGEQQGR